MAKNKYGWHCHAENNVEVWEVENEETHEVVGRVKPFDHMYHAEIKVADDWQTHDFANRVEAGERVGSQFGLTGIPIEA